MSGPELGAGGEDSVVGQLGGCMTIVVVGGEIFCVLCCSLGGASKRPWVRLKGVLVVVEDVVDGRR